MVLPEVPGRRRCAEARASPGVPPPASRPAVNTRPAFVERFASLRRAKDLIDRDFAEPLDLDAMAAEAGYSRFHFTRSFREAFGRTPREYLSWRRVERARELLRTASLSVTEVCMLVGFSSVGTFSARFKRVVGLSPRDLRERAVASGGRPPIPGCFVLMWSATPMERNREEAGTPDQR